jgi:hypothetical protein
MRWRRSSRLSPVAGSHGLSTFGAVGTEFQGEILEHARPRPRRTLRVPRLHVVLLGSVRAQTQAAR